MDTSEHPEMMAVARWKRVFFVWAVFFTLLFLASVVIAKRVHSSADAGVLWAGIFTALYWLPAALCRQKLLLLSSLLSFAIGAVWLFRVVSSIGALTLVINKPPAQGILPEIALVITGIAAVVVFVTGGFQIYRADRIMKRDMAAAQGPRTEVAG